MEQQGSCRHSLVAKLCAELVDVKDFDEFVYLLFETLALPLHLKGFSLDFQAGGSPMQAPATKKTTSCKLKGESPSQPPAGDSVDDTVLSFQTAHNQTAVCHFLREAKAGAFDAAEMRSLEEAILPTIRFHFNTLLAERRSDLSEHQWTHRWMDSEDDFSLLLGANRLPIQAPQNYSRKLSAFFETGPWEVLPQPISEWLEECDKRFLETDSPKEYHSVWADRQGKKDLHVEARLPKETDRTSRTWLRFRVQPKPTDLLSTLNEQERTLLDAIPTGHTNVHLADMMGLSVSRIKQIMRKLHSKLGTSTKAGLAKFRKQYP